MTKHVDVPIEEVIAGKTREFLYEHRINESLDADPRDIAAVRLPTGEVLARIRWRGCPRWLWGAFLAVARISYPDPVWPPKPTGETVDAPEPPAR